MDSMEYCNPMVQWQDERDAICFELRHLTGSINTLLVEYLAGWVKALPEQVRSEVFDPDRMIRALSGKKRCWDREIRMWEAGDWEGLLRHGDIDPDEYLLLVERYPTGNPKYPGESAEHYRHFKRPLAPPQPPAAEDQTAAGKTEGGLGSDPPAPVPQVESSGD